MDTIISYILDIILVIAAIGAFIARPRIGGLLAKGMQSLSAGLLVLGFAHLLETMLSTFWNIDEPLNEVVHRFLVLLGFVFIIIGFIRMRKAFDS